ncbi:MAG: ligand-gated channel, partial [Bradyrhizobium sp.]
MSGNIRRHAAGAASLLFCGMHGGAAFAQTTAPTSTLPDITVTAPQGHATPSGPKKPKTRVATGTNHRARRTGAVSATPESPEQAQARAVASQNTRLDQARATLLAPTGANTYQMSQQFLQSLPQGTNTTLDKALLQAPGVSQDSAASGELHVRNEHANLQYRINGIMLPDGVGAFGQIIDTGIVGSMA